MGKEYEENLLKRLDALIAVLLSTVTSESSSINKVEILKNVGLDYKTIANILNTSPNSISVMFAKLNKKK